MVVHNILETENDDPTTIAGFNGQEDDAVIADHQEQRNRADAGEELVGDDWYRAGLLRRKLLVDYMENMNL